jgi:hypothetical protein
LNIPLHIAEQGKDKIQEYIELYQKKAETSRLANESEERLDLVFREMQNIFVKEEKASYYSEYRLKRRSLWDHIGDYYKYSGEKKALEKTKVISQFVDQVWTLNQALQNAALDRIEKSLAHQEAKEKFEQFK